MNQMIAQVVSTMKWVSLGVIVFGEKVNIWNTIGMTPPGIYTWSQQNKVVSCMGAFFLSNAIENALVQTGAFEVELNGIPIWSKLKTGRVPQGSELFEIIDNQFLTSPKDKKPTGQFELPVNTKVEEEEEAEAGDSEMNDYERTENQMHGKKYDEFSEIDQETQERPDNEL